MNNNEKHTKGPWKVEFLNYPEMRDELNDKFRGDGVYSFGSVDGTLVGITMTDSDASKANSQLISAAPELLEVLKNILKLTLLQILHNNCSCVKCGTVKLAQEIVKKAEGNL